MQDAIKTGVRAIVGAGVAPTSVVWSDEERPAANTVVVLTIVQLGSDHDRECYEEDPDDATQLVWKLSTLQYMRVQIRVESIYNAPRRDGLFVAERIRAAMHSPFTSWGPEVIQKPDVNTYMHHVPFPHQGRLVSGWSFETNFRAVTDFPTEDGNGVAAGTNMRTVEVVGEDADPPGATQLIERP
jgi:hypothetical protein